MKLCTLLKVRAGLYRCTQPRCGQEVPVPDDRHVPNSRCQVQDASNPNEWTPPATPPLATRVANLAASAGAAAVHGTRQLTQAEIDARFAICQGCVGPGGYFSGDTCTHGSCGCGVSSQAGLLNKLAWSHEACPLGKWTAS